MRQSLVFGLGAVGLGLVLGGCGLLLDLDPKPDGGPDSGRRGMDGAVVVTGCAQDSECDNDDVCDGVERCVAERCVRGQRLDCDDGIECSEDRCDARLGCESRPRDGRCDDGLECTLDRCDLEVGCVYDPDHRICARADSVLCTSDRCDPSDDTHDPDGCVNTPEPLRCDQDECSSVDGCAERECEYDIDCGEFPPNCVVFFCGEDGFCHREAAERLVDGPVTCDDGDPCTAESLCVRGNCVGRGITTCPGQACARCDWTGGGCENPLLADAGLPCTDNDLCTTGDICDGSGHCGGEPIECEATVGCTAQVCEPSMGCQPAPAPEGSACDDGLLCTLEDSCGPRGLCTGPCAEGAICAEDSCGCIDGWADCNSDGDCRCDLSVSHCTPEGCERLSTADASVVDASILDASSGDSGTFYDGSIGVDASTGPNDSGVDGGGPIPADSGIIVWDGGVIVLDAGPMGPPGPVPTE